MFKLAIVLIGLNPLRLSPRWTTASIGVTTYFALDPRAISTLLTFEDLFECRGQRWKAIRQRFPEHIQVEVKIGVNQAVTHSYDLVPRYIGIPGSEFRRDLAGCLTNHL
jgi:hypothetical protein